MEFRQVRPEDWQQVKKIYEEGIGTGHATFETQAPELFEQWISSAVKGCTIVAAVGNDLLGWCKLSKVSDRCVYAGVAEVSIYVHSEYKGKGVGRSLMEEIIKCSEDQRIWTLQAGIFPENLASTQLHKKYGFREIGRREKIGKMKGVWRDTLLFERRSTVVGVD